MGYIFPDKLKFQVGLVVSFVFGRRSRLVQARHKYSHTAHTLIDPISLGVDLYHRVKALSEVDHLHAFPVSGHRENIIFHVLE